MNRWLVESVILPLHERAMGRPTFRAYRESIESRSLSADEFHALRTDKLRRLLIHARETTAFYRARFDEAGVDPRGDNPWSALRALPALTRDEVREHGKAMRSHAAGPLTVGSTSGSSGEPLRYAIGRRRAAFDKACRYRAWRDWGIRIGDRKAWLWGVSAPRSLTTRVKTLRDRLTNEIVISAYDMTPERMREAVDRLHRYRPRCVTCYPSAGWRLARFAEDEGLPLREAGVEVVFCTGEMLDPIYRETIARGFGAKVANEYGLREAGLVAHECPEGTMHAMDEAMAIERRGGDGAIAGAGETSDEVGELVVTNLEGYGMPMIRYRTRDYARVVRRACSCGWTSDAIEGLSGRQTDFLIAAGGTPKVGFVLSRGFWSVPGVRQFKVVQESIDRTRVLIVPDKSTGAGDAFDDEARRRIVELVRDALGESVEVVVETVETIPREPSGKSRYIESRIAADYL